MSWELLSGLEEKLHDLFADIKKPSRDKWEKHYIGEVKRESRDYTKKHGLKPEPCHYGPHYSVSISTDGEKRIECRYHKGKLIEVKVY